MTSPIPFERFERFATSQRGNAVPVPSLDAVRKPSGPTFATRAIAKLAFANADLHDHDGAFPEAEIAELHRGGLLAASLPRSLGGVAPTAHELAAWLRQIGSSALAQNFKRQE
jgi:alkylation response protein AidB-like acyl-CoA dehydrogenase